MNYINQWGKSHRIPARSIIKLYRVGGEGELEVTVKFSRAPGGAHYHRFSGKDADHFIAWATGFVAPRPPVSTSPFWGTR